MPRAFRLTRKDDIFDVAQTIHGAVCDCPDFIFRRDGLDPEDTEQVLGDRRAQVDGNLAGQQCK